MVSGIVDRQNGIGLRTRVGTPQFITDASEALGFDVGVIDRLIRHESKGNPKAVSFK